MASEAVKVLLLTYIWYLLSSATSHKDWLTALLSVITEEIPLSGRGAI